MSQAPPRLMETTLEAASIPSLVLALARRVLFSTTTIRAGALLLVLGLAYVATKKKRDLKGKTILVTGAAGGLGRAQATAFAKRGCKVLIWDISSKVEQTASEIMAAVPGSVVAGYVVNLADKDSVFALAAKNKKEHGFIWGLVNNAGLISGQNLMDTDNKKIEMIFQVNVLAHFWTCKSFLPEMMEKNDGHIVGVSSAAGFFPSARMTDYCSSKFAARGFMESLRIELASLGKSGVRTTLVAPAHINTDLFKGYSLGTTMEPDWVAEKIVEGIENDYPLMFLPYLPLMMGNLWQGVFPIAIWDLFMMPTNSQLSTWNPAQANTIFNQMDKKQ